MSVYAQSCPDLPHLQKQGTATQLVVENKPFLILGGELGNSMAYQGRHIRIPVGEYEIQKVKLYRYR